jgi:uncharacterized membrane protein YeaQ/YmgE (transglycosylase-associated protein family)
MRQSTSFGTLAAIALGAFRFAGEDSGNARNAELNDQTIEDKGERRMGIIAWLVLGLLAGFIGSKIVNKTGEGMLMDILIGIVGAALGGWIAGFFGFNGVTGLNIPSLIIAVVGSIVLLLIYRAVRRAM